MHAILPELGRIFKASMGNPESTIMLVVCAILAIVAAGVVLKLVAEPFGCKMVNANRVMLLLGVVVVLAFVAAVVTGAFVVPRMAASAVAPWLPLIVAVVIVLAGAVPLGCLILKAGYFQALFSLLLSMAAAAALVTAAHYGMGAVKAGGKSIERSKEQAEQRRVLP